MYITMKTILEDTTCLVVSIIHTAWNFHKSCNRKFKVRTDSCKTVCLPCVVAT